MVNHVVDVRDCAGMHIAVMDDPSTDGHRHFAFGAVGAVGAVGKMTELTDAIRKNYSRLGFRLKPWVLPTWLLEIASLFSSEVGSLYSKLGHPNLYVTKWPDVYRYRHTDTEEIVKASMDSMLAHGWPTPGPPVARPSADPIADFTEHPASVRPRPGGVKSRRRSGEIQWRPI